MSLRYLVEHSNIKRMKNSLKLEYNGKELLFPISNVALNGKLIRSSARDNEVVDENSESMMEVVDRYMEIVPEASQSLIFNIFSELEDIIYRTPEAELVNTLQSLSWKIFSLPGITPGNPVMMEYVKVNAEIPVTVFKSMEEAPSSYKEESTYLVHEYYDFVCLNIYIDKHWNSTELNNWINCGGKPSCNSYNLISFFDSSIS